MKNIKRRASLKDRRRLRSFAMLIPNEILLRRILDDVQGGPAMRRQVFFAMQPHLRFRVSNSLCIEMTMGMKRWRFWCHLRWRRVVVWWRAQIRTRWGRGKL